MTAIQESRGKVFFGNVRVAGVADIYQSRITALLSVFWLVSPEVEHPIVGAPGIQGLDAEIANQTLILAFGLGLLGFVEPCTVGAHTLFFQGQRPRSMAQRLRAVVAFLLARILVMGGFGGAIVYLEQRLIGVQTGAWLAFGLLYLALGLGIVARVDGRVRRRRRGLSPRTLFGAGGATDAENSD